MYNLIFNLEEWKSIQSHAIWSCYLTQVGLKRVETSLRSRKRSAVNLHSLSWPAGGDSSGCKVWLYTSVKKASLCTHCRHEFMVSISSFKSPSTQRDVHVVNWPLICEISRVILCQDMKGKHSFTIPPPPLAPLYLIIHPSLPLCSYALHPSPCHILPALLPHATL